ncbi:MAG: SDR family NAD(P)-dependent oxidoreductase, partial [Alphaproteobacteria bacterium]|nr:SDR family NAD(P)-dependent oxidoreductase [Alphaproteobacteria bacterium]
MNITNLFSVKNRTALVTGGNSGLGEAMATALGLAGAQLVLVGRDVKKLEQVEQRLTPQNIKVKTIAANLAKLETIAGVAEQAENAFGAIDIIINAAGVNLRESFVTVSPATWQEQTNIHLGAPFFLTQAIAPHMKQRGFGRIINIASLQSMRAFPNSAPYGAGKGGIVQLTRAIAEEWSRYGINCNAIGPGFFSTPLTAPVFGNPELVQKHAAQT